MSAYREIPSAQERSWAIGCTMDELFAGNSKYMVCVLGFTGHMNTHPADTHIEAIRLARAEDKRTGCWTCVCDRQGVIWQAFIAIERIEEGEVQS